MQHLLARPVIDHGGAADRLRNHLRRRAITRVGRIEGRLLLLPYARAEAEGPGGETSVHILAAELGDPRLRLAHLPPADLSPFDQAAVPPGAVLVPATLPEDRLLGAGRAAGWRTRSLGSLVHYPFWLLHLEDHGATEGAWIDAVEGRIIHHAIGSVPRVPARARRAGLLALPAAIAALPVLAGLPPATVVAVSTAAAAAAGVLVRLEGLRIERRRASGW